MPVATAWAAYCNHLLRCDTVKLPQIDCLQLGQLPRVPQRANCSEGRDSACIAPGDSVANAISTGSKLGYETESKVPMVKRPVSAVSSDSYTLLGQACEVQYLLRQLHTNNHNLATRAHGVRPGVLLSARITTYTSSRNLNYLDSLLLLRHCP